MTEVFSSAVYSVALPKPAELNKVIKIVSNGSKSDIKIEVILNIVI